MSCIKLSSLIQAPAPASVVPSVPVRGIDTGGLGGLDADGAGRVFRNAAACRGDVNVGAAAARSSPGGAAVFAAVVTIVALGRGVLTSADRHGSGDGAPVAASDVGVVPGIASLGCWLFLPRLRVSGSPAAVEVDRSVIVQRSLVDDAPISSNSQMTTTFSS